MTCDLQSVSSDAKVMKVTILRYHHYTSTVTRCDGENAINVNKTLSVIIELQKGESGR